MIRDPEGLVSVKGMRAMKGMMGDDGDDVKETRWLVVSLL